MLDAPVLGVPVAHSGGCVVPVADQIIGKWSASKKGDVTFPDQCGGTLEQGADPPQMLRASIEGSFLTLAPSLMFAVMSKGIFLFPFLSLWWPSLNSSARCCCTSRLCRHPKTSQKERCSLSTRNSLSCKDTSASSLLLRFIGFIFFIIFFLCRNVCIQIFISGFRLQPTFRCSFS